ncbi:MAG: hypothetical protein MJZ09_07970 [Bacteroidales bacterium]|nr:hypothetical protein [Bacteroidales bacterium]
MNVSSQTKAVFAEKTNDFGIRLFDAAQALSQNENVIISPLSCAWAMSMAAMGAEGDTYSEIVNALGYSGKTKEEVGSFSKAVISELASADEKAVLESANSIWADHSLDVKKSYTESASVYYDALTTGVDFASNDGKDKINSWISESTHGIVNDVVKQTDGWVLALVNTLYFKSTWNISTGVEEMEFQDIDGKKKACKFLMTNQAKAAESEDYTYVSMPFGTNGSFEFELLMTNDCTKPVSMDMSVVSDFRKEAANGDFSFAMPFLMFECSTDLKEALLQLGIKNAFDMRAQFGAISDESLYLSQVLQSSRIYLDEKGAEAASGTVVGAELSAGINPDRKHIVADHPFAFLIRNVETNTILFVGQKVK